MQQARPCFKSNWRGGVCCVAAGTAGLEQTGQRALSLRSVASLAGQTLI